MNTRRIGSSRPVGKAGSSAYSASSRRAHEADVLGRTVECIWFDSLRRGPDYVNSATGMNAGEAGDFVSQIRVRRWCASLDAAVASLVMRAQSCAAGTSDGVIQKPPTQSTFGKVK